MRLKLRAVEASAKQAPLGPACHRSTLTYDPAVLPGIKAGLTAHAARGLPVATKRSLHA